MTWKKVKLGEVLFHQESRYKPNDEKIAGLKRIEKIDFSGNIYLSDSKSRTDMIVIKSGELIISGINVYKGAVAIYEGKEDITATIHYSSYRVKTEKIEVDFLKLFLKSPKFLDAIKEQIPGGIKTEIKPKHLLPLEVKIPDLSKQNDIVQSFVNFENQQALLINELSHQLDIVKKLRQQILQDAVQGKLVNQNQNDEPASILLEKIKAEKEQLIKEKKLKKDKPLSPIKAEEIPFEIPENWVWCRFSDIVEIESNSVSPFDFPNHPHIAPDNIEKNTGKLLNYKTVLQDEVKSVNHYFYPGQLIYSKVRPKLNKIVKVDFEGLCSADMYPLRPLINADFLLYSMLSSYFAVEVDRFDNRVKMPKINQNQLSQISVPLPPLPEQHRIVAKVESLMRLCDELEASIRQNQSYTEQLLQSALREPLQ